MKKFYWNYGLMTILLTIIIIIKIYWYSKLGFFATINDLVSLFSVAAYSYINGWHRGRFESVEEEKRITQKVKDASSVRGKTKPKTRR